MKHSRTLVFGTLLMGAIAKPNQAAPDQVAEVSRVFIIGKVQKPGAYSFSTNWRLLDAIAAAGGMSANPNSLRLSVQRGKIDSPIDLHRLLFLSDKSQNLSLLSGDVVVVDEIGSTSVPTVPPERYSLPLQPKGKELPKPDFEFFPNARFWLLNKYYN